MKYTFQHSDRDLSPLVRRPQWTHICWAFWFLSITTTLAVTQIVHASDALTEPGQAAIESRFLVLLNQTDAARPNTEALNRLQTGHLANLRAMAEAKLLLVAGPTRPIDDGRPALAGVLIFKADSESDLETIKTMLQQDPMINAGLLTAHTYRFMFESGDNLYERRERELTNGTN